MDSGPEREVSVRPPLEIQSLGPLVRIRVHVGGRHHGGDLVALLQADAAELDVLAHEARLGELYRRDEAQEFLDRQIDPAPVLREPIAQRGVLDELVDRSADQMGGGFRAGAQQQKNHCHHLVGADPFAFDFDPHQLRDQAFAALLPRDPQAPFQIAPHLVEAAEQAQEADDAGDARDSVGPGDESRPVGGRQTEQFADDRERQHPRIADDQIGRAALREQLIGERVGDGANTRLHVEDGAAAERLVDDAAQAGVVRLVHGQHVVGHRADHGRHPPPHPGNAAVLAQRERLAVLQDAARHVVRRRDPDLADDRKPGLDDRSERPQPLDAGGRIAKIGLTQEIHTPRHARRSCCSSIEMGAADMM
jgi:hypothetical protein